ncbi:MAG: right-handed parallel beta-helix repeat-containing protein [Chloroflexi bacterium]|nr:right-handed parallel beta-helix repeat-containing protein [Chloroflexota bacterium]
MNTHTRAPGRFLRASLALSLIWLLAVSGLSPAVGATATPAALPCNVAGAIAADATWGPLLCDPYIVTANVTVLGGVTLTILPGTTVRFQAGTSLIVSGRLDAQGVAGDQIVFTSDEALPDKGDWGYILFDPTSADDPLCDGSGSILRQAVVEYAGGAAVGDNGAVRIQNSGPCIDGNTMRYSGDYAITAFSEAYPNIDNNEIYENGVSGGFAPAGGIYIHGSSAHINGNFIHDNTDSGIYTSYGYEVSITSNTIRNNSTIGGGGGMRLNAYRGSTTVIGNHIEGNSAGASGGGIYFSVDFMYGHALISGNTITGNSANYGGGIQVEAHGGEVSDNVITANTALFSGGGIYVGASTYTTILDNAIVGNSATTAHGGGGIYLNSGTRPPIHGNALYENTADDPATPNDLYNGNPAGGEQVDAEHNCWRTDILAEIEDRVWHGVDNVALGLVDFDPFDVWCMALVDDPDYAVTYDHWAGVADPLASGGGYRADNTSGRTLTYRTAQATRSITLLSYLGPDQGKAEIFVDGNSQGVLDLYWATAVYQHAVRFGGLPNARHSILVKVLGEKNPLSTGTEVRVDAFQYRNLTVEDDGATVQYDLWVGRLVGAAFGGSVHYNSTASASVFFDFVGTQFTWISAHGPMLGKADVLVDGGFLARVDLCNANNWQFQQEEVFDGLPYGAHTVQIRVVGQHDPACNGDAVVFDGYSPP